MSFRKLLTLFVVYMYHMYMYILLYIFTRVYMCMCPPPSHHVRFKREVWEDVLVQLAQIALFRYSPHLPTTISSNKLPVFNVAPYFSCILIVEPSSRVNLHPSAIFQRSSYWTCSKGKYPYVYCVKVHVKLQCYDIVVVLFILCSESFPQMF